LAEDIHAIHFAYAFDNDGDGELDFVDGDGDGELDADEEIWAYDSDGGGDLDWDSDAGTALAAAVSFDKIRAVRVWILARTKHPLRGYSRARSFNLGDQFVPGKKNFKYRLLTTTVKCRNMGV
jgi:type IV pilus assembly protein PilW